MSVDVDASAIVQLAILAIEFEGVLSSKSAHYLFKQTKLLLAIYGLPSCTSKSFIFLRFNVRSPSEQSL